VFSIDISARYRTDKIKLLGEESLDSPIKLKHENEIQNFSLSKATRMVDEKLRGVNQKPNDDFISEKIKPINEQAKIMLKHEELDNN